MKISLMIFLLAPFAMIAQHVSKAYYNVVNDRTDWFSTPLAVDYKVSIVHYESYSRITTNGQSDYVLTDTLSANGGFTKWSALDWKGDDCQVSLGINPEDNTQYMIVQYPDMGWCSVFDKE
jgi:hypothetical protein